MSPEEILRQLLGEADRCLAEVQQRRERLAEEQRRRKETERRREEAERRLAEVRQLREEAEWRAITELNTLPGLLDGCHKLSLAISIETKVALRTKGDPVNPVNRIHPRRVLHWHEFPKMQQKIWDEFIAEPAFTSQHLFPSPHQLDYVRSRIEPIYSEDSLRDFERDTVKNFAEDILDRLSENKSFRQRFKLTGRVTLEGHADMENSEMETSLEETMEQMRITEQSIQRSESTLPRDRQGAGRAGPRRRRNRRADQFCVHVLADERRLPVYAVEFKAPHKLTLPELVAGLHEMEPARDVIDKDGDGFEYHATRLVAAIITQLFSYMVDCGVQYGYICTGEAFVFLHIPDDPSIVRYYLCVPNLDVIEHDEYRLQRTAVAQVLCFTLNALAADPPPQSWHAAAAMLDTWKGDYLDVLLDIPESVLNSPPDLDYKPSIWKPLIRSPYLLRNRCRQKPKPSQEETDDTPPSPLPRRGASSRRGQGAGRRGSGRRGTPSQGCRRGKPTSSKQSSERGAPRQYCTVKCIHGMVEGGPLDLACPNVQSHGSQNHLLSPQEFIRRLCLQLSSNPEKDFEPLHIRGRTGFVMKATLTSHGYTVVIKATTADLVSRLQHEKKVYDLLHSLQGSEIPVCIGDFSPQIPYYYHGQVMAHMLVLSWAGIRTQNIVNKDNEHWFLQKREVALSKIRSFGVIHKDVAWRNVLWNEETSSAIIIDFEDAILTLTLQSQSRHPNAQKPQSGKFLQSLDRGPSRQPLNQVSGNHSNHKGNHKPGQGSDDEKLLVPLVEPLTAPVDRESSI
ncbi:hypothetical protein VTO42DRAFT_1745 [Malbranchea cinnamomea]